MKRTLAIAMSLTAIALASLNCRGVQRTAIRVLDQPPETPEGALQPLFEGRDAARERADVALEVVAEGFPQLTDIQPVPDRPTELVVLQKSGTATLLDRVTGKRTNLLSVEVVTVSEQGLLGLAFHPKFTENGRFYLNYTPKGTSPEVTRVAEWAWADGSPREVRTVLEVEQPFQNHNAGQIAFGPDGMLYIGLGDGGLKDDPMGHGQDGRTLLGSMLRLDVDHLAPEQPYAIPPDNPFLDRPEVRDEVFARGLRNPWRYTFAPDGVLVVADVGQGTWEEVSLVPPGANLGWNTREGRHCFPPGSECDSAGLIDPVFEYDHGEGVSITGGVVVTGNKVPILNDRYLFGDFVSGRLWALSLPDTPGTPAAEPLALGRWPILPVTFALDSEGTPLVGDFGGRILAIKAVQ